MRKEADRLLRRMHDDCPDARERAGPVFPPPPQEETQAQRARARRDKHDGRANYSSVVSFLRRRFRFDLLKMCVMAWQ